MVIGLICSGCINLTSWSTYTESRANFAQSHQRRFSRWLKNSRINVHRLYKPIIQDALADWDSSDIRVIEDTTMLWNQYCLEHRFSNTKNYFLGYSDNEISAFENSRNPRSGLDSEY